MASFLNTALFQNTSISSSILFSTEENTWKWLAKFKKLKKKKKKNL